MLKQEASGEAEQAAVEIRLSVKERSEGAVEIRAMSGFSAATSAAAAERCALAIRTRPAASSPATRQQASIRRSTGPRRPATLAASRRGPVAPRAVATPADRASPEVRTSVTVLRLAYLR